jgi:hypothetical protein
MKYPTLVQGRTAIIVCEILLGTARHKQISGGESLPRWYLPNDKCFAAGKENVTAHEIIYVTKKKTKIKQVFLLNQIVVVCHEIKNGPFKSLVLS